MTYRVALVSTVVSPFQVEVADAINEHTAIDYHVLFSVGESSHRGSHWQIPETNHPGVHSPGPDVNDRGAWTSRLLARLRPSIVILGGYRGDGFRGARAYAHSSEASVGLWGEPPSPRSTITSRLRRAIIANQLRGLDFVLAIGERAYEAYAPLVRAGQAHLVPYGQDLSRHLAVKRTGVPTQPVFLFSGRLIRRHNLAALFCALAEVARQRPGTFEVVVAADGPEQGLLDQCVASSPELAAALSYDREYETWDDRVRPFEASDILLYPSLHSGWGLVVPEAMAASMLVVSTTNVEAARYLITPGVDGLMIDGSKASVVEAVTWCLDHPESVRQMGERARISAQRVTAERTAAVLSEVLGQYAKPNL